MFWPILLILEAFLLLALVLATVGGLIALWVTGPRERVGAERLVVTPAGIARVALRPTAGQSRFDTLFTPFDGANSVEIKRISPVWRRLRLRVVTPGAGVARQVFDAGFRCPDAHAPEVERMVREYVRRALPADTPTRSE